MVYNPYIYRIENRSLRCPTKNIVWKIAESRVDSDSAMNESIRAPIRIGSSDSVESTDPTRAFFFFPRPSLFALKKGFWTNEKRRRGRRFQRWRRECEEGYLPPPLLGFVAIVARIRRCCPLGFATATAGLSSLPPYRWRREWSGKLVEALWAYLTTIRGPTQATLFSLVYGSEAVLPLEVQIPSLRVPMQWEFPT